MTPRENETRIVLYKTPLFERCLDDLRRKGGTASEAAARIDVILSNLLQSAKDSRRERFRYTRNGEYRIKYCKKISLGCGYRLVLLQKDDCCILLYAASHDDCLRWIERNKGLSYEVNHTTREVRVMKAVAEDTDALPEDVLEEKQFVERYENNLMKQIDDNVLSRIFSGFCESRQLQENSKHK